MKQFLYLDNDIVNSIIAQAEKGIIVQQTSERNVGEENTSQEKGELETGLKGGASFLKILSASAHINASYATDIQKTGHFAKREMEEKTLHDAAFDIAMSYIDPLLKPIDDELTEGDYTKLKCEFDYVDFDYLEGLFNKNGFIDLIKKQQAESIRNAAAPNAARQAKGDGYKKSQIEDAVRANDKQYDDVLSLITALRGLIPYKRMLYSEQGGLIPLDDQFFRIDYTNLGFKYGGEMTCVGMVTNTISADDSSKSNVFGSLQVKANQGLRGLLSFTSGPLYVIHPIAVYYGQ